MRLNNWNLKVDGDSEFKEKVRKALAAERKRIADRKEWEEFDLEATIYEIMEYLRKDEHKGMPAESKLSELLGPSDGTFSHHYDEILAALKAILNNWDFKVDGDARFKEKVRQALADKIREIAERKEPKEFDPEATIAEIIRYLRNPEHKEMPIPRELSGLLGPSQPTFYAYYNKILDALEARLNNWNLKVDGDSEFKEKVRKALAAKREEIAAAREAREAALNKEERNLLEWADGHQGRTITKKYLEKIKEGLNKNLLLKLDEILSSRNISVDGAMAGRGGIDLTPANMNLQTRNNNVEIRFHMDPAMLQQLQNAPGFTPVIINIRPMTDLRLFLGLSDNSRQTASL